MSMLLPQPGLTSVVLQTLTKLAILESLSCGPPQKVPINIRTWTCYSRGSGKWERRYLSANCSVAVDHQHRARVPKLLCDVAERDRTAELRRNNRTGDRTGFLAAGLESGAGLRSHRTVEE